MITRPKNYLVGVKRDEPFVIDLQWRDGFFATSYVIFVHDCFFGRKANIEYYTDPCTRLYRCRLIITYANSAEEVDRFVSFFNKPLLGYVSLIPLWYRSLIRR